MNNKIIFYAIVCLALFSMPSYASYESYTYRLPFNYTNNETSMSNMSILMKIPYLNNSLSSGCDIAITNSTDSPIPWRWAFSNATGNNSFVIITTGQTIANNSVFSGYIYEGLSGQNCTINTTNVMSSNPMITSFWFFDNDTTTIPDLGSGGHNATQTGGDAWDVVPGFNGSKTTAMNNSGALYGKYYNTSNWAQNLSKSLSCLGNIYTTTGINVMWSHGPGTSLHPEGSSQAVYSVNVGVLVFDAALQKTSWYDIYKNGVVPTTLTWNLFTTIFNNSEGTHIYINATQLTSLTNGAQYISTALNTPMFFFSSFGAEWTSGNTYKGALQFCAEFDGLWTDGKPQALYQGLVNLSRTQFGSEEASFKTINITLTSPSIGINHNTTINLSYYPWGLNLSYTCFHVINNATSSNYSLNNNTEYSTWINFVNGTNNLTINCTYNTTNSIQKNYSIINQIGYVLLNTYFGTTGAYTQANITSILVYNSSSSVNFTGNNFTWYYTSLPGGNINIVAFYSNITRETTIINNATNYQNISLVFPTFSGNFNFLINNIYSSPIENVLTSFYQLDGTLITQKYSQSDGYVYDVFITYNIPITITTSKTGFIDRSISFTPYLTTNLPVIIRLEANATPIPPSPMLLYATTNYICYLTEIAAANNVLTCNASGTYLTSSCLYAVSITNTSNITDCNYCNSSTSKTCQLGTISGQLHSYSLTGNYSDYWLPLTDGYIDRTSFNPTFGNWGVFLVLVLFLVMTFIFFANPVIGILGGLGAIVFGSILGFVDISNIALIGIILVGMIIMYKVGQR